MSSTTLRMGFPASLNGPVHREIYEPQACRLRFQPDQTWTSGGKRFLILCAGVVLREVGAECWIQRRVESSHKHRQPHEPSQRPCSQCSIARSSWRVSALPTETARID